MTPEEFRIAGHKLIDWISDYRLGLDEFPVRAQVDPGEVKSHFSDKPPESPVEFDALLEELERAIVPGITQAQHPMHFGWFPSNATLSSVL
jgi:aromatic-L-amino-acid decarboxylase